MGISIGDNLQYFLFAQHILFAYKVMKTKSVWKYVRHRMLTNVSTTKIEFYRSISIFSVVS